MWFYKFNSSRWINSLVFAVTPVKSFQLPSYFLIGQSFTMWEIVWLAWPQSHFGVESGSRVYVKLPRFSRPVWIKLNFVHSSRYELNPVESCVGSILPYFWDTPKLLQSSLHAEFRKKFVLLRSTGVLHRCLHLCPLLSSDNANFEVLGRNGRETLSWLDFGFFSTAKLCARKLSQIICKILVCILINLQKPCGGQLYERRLFDSFKCENTRYLCCFMKNQLILLTVYNALQSLLP